MPFACRRIFFYAFFTLLLFHGYGQSDFCPLQPAQNIFWNSLTGNNGLSQNSVTSILQDSRGFIWIGTYDGLNRFDGFSTQIKRHESNNLKSLSDNRILCLHEDRRGNILIGTDGGGLNIFDVGKEVFEHIQLKSGNLQNNMIVSVCTDKNGNIWTCGNNTAIIPATQGGYNTNNIYFPASLTNNLASKIICDRAGNMWIGTNNGLYFSKAEPSLEKRLKEIVPVKGFEHTLVNALYQDSHQNIWIGTNGDLYTIGFIGDQSSNEMVVKERYKTMFEGTEARIDISDIVSDRSGNIWISSRNEGVFKFKYANEGRFAPMERYNTDQPFCNISENMIRVLCVDLSNTLWMGSYRKGVNYFNLSNKNFFSFNPLLSNERDELGYKGKYITAVTEDDRMLWVGTYDEGLYQYNKCSGKISNYNTRNIGTNNIISLYRSKQGALWVGTNLGLYKMDDNGTVEMTLKKGAAIRSTSEDKFGRLWIATWDGITVYDPITKNTQQLSVKEGLSSNICFTLYADPEEAVMWAGTIGGGLNRVAYSRSNDFSFTHYLNKETDTNTISNNHVWSIYRDHNNVLWIGTDAGLNKCLMDNNQGKTVFRRVDNPLLKDRKITSILEDNDSNLWLSSSQGLFRFNAKNNSAKQYTYKDGLQSNNFSEAAFKNATGRMYFGGINGLNYFEPQNINSNPYLPATAIVDLKIFNHSVKPGEKVGNNIILQNDINATEEITLTYKQNNFLLNFAALHYAVPEDNQFRYKLEGYDKDWITTGHDQRFAAYSNLDAGTYTFKLTSSNNDDVWSKEVRTITINIKPAPWLTWWAKTLYALCLMGIAWLAYSYYKSKHHFANELYLEKIEKEKVTELNELKLNFFTNITHELRTPLNLISGPIQELIRNIDTFDKFAQFRLKLIHKNTTRLMTLINQVLDLRKISADTESLNISKNELIKTIQEIKKSFDWMADQKQVNYIFNYIPSSVYGWFDKDKIEKITFNLLSNAFKYVPESGSVTIDLSLIQQNMKDDTAQIIISDTGPGIEEEDQKNIFKLFYQGKQQEGFGSGIGLSLCSKLIELHRGNIAVKSEKGKGAAFILQFPISEFAYKNEEIKENTSANEFEVQGGPPEEIFVPEINKRKTVLLIEDDDDQREYIKECLSGEFNVRDERNGNDGFETAKKVSPDVIITDIMMPGINGITLTKKLKEDKKTHHIPLIVHSVKNSSTTLQEALEAGADDIIPKPFDYRLLSLKINNLLRTRHDLLAAVKKEQIMQPAEIIVPSDEEELLKKILALVEENMSDPDFGVEKLARLSAMSRMNLHRKLHAVTGKTASELIREIRLKRAGQLLSAGSMRISEVMLEVGISSNYHFNKYFKEMYGMTTKDFIKNNAN